MCIRDRGLALDAANGNIVVSDTNNHRIQVRRTDYACVTGPHALHSIEHSTPVVHYAMSLPSKACTQIFSHLGKHLKAFGSHGSAKGQVSRQICLLLSLQRYARFRVAMAWSQDNASPCENALMDDLL